MELNFDALKPASESRKTSKLVKCLIAITIGIVAMALISKDFRLLYATVFVPLIIFIFWILAGGIFRPSKSHEKYRQFAADNTFTFHEKLPAKYWPPRIGEVNGITSWVDFHITGNLKNNLFKLFSFYHELPQQNATPLYKHEWVLYFEFPEKAPRFVIDAKYNGISLRKVFSGYNQLKLEGDFSEYFNVYAKPGDQVDVLSILTPDVMYALREFWQNIDVIVSDRSLWLIGRDQDTEDWHDLVELFDAAAIMIPEFAHQLRSS